MECVKNMICDLKFCPMCRVGISGDFTPKVDRIYQGQIAKYYTKEFVKQQDALRDAGVLVGDYVTVKGSVSESNIPYYTPWNKAGYYDSHMETVDVSVRIGSGEAHKVKMEYTFYEARHLTNFGVSVAKKDRLQEKRFFQVAETKKDQITEAFRAAAEQDG